MNVGAALAANNPSDRDEFAAEAAPTTLKTSVFSVTPVANNYRINPPGLVKTCIKHLVCSLLFMLPVAQGSNQETGYIMPAGAVTKTLIHATLTRLLVGHLRTAGYQHKLLA